MKRYWKIITLCLVTVVVIGVFYIQSSLAAETVVIEFEKVSGNEDEVKNLVINADYVIDNVHQPLLISEQETINLNNQSLYQQIFGFNAVTTYKELIDKYGSFMRGKELLQHNFYEDENLVAYVRVEGNYSTQRKPYFDIDILEIKSKKSASMKLDVPKKGNYNWVDVADIQQVDGYLKVIARGFQHGGGMDLNVYTVDIDKQMIVHEETIESAPAVKDGWSDITISGDYYSSKPAKYLLFHIDAFEHGSDEMEVEPTVITDEYVIYDIEQNQTKKIVMDEEIQEMRGEHSIHGSTIYIPSMTPTGIEVHQYDIENQKWGEKQIIDVDFSEDEGHVPFVKLLNGKLYIIGSTSEGHTISIRDLETGQSLYEGKISIKNQHNNQKNYQLYIHEIK